MELSKKYLETVSIGELLQLAEIYGLYIPEGLNRNFIIEELLDLNEENETPTYNSPKLETLDDDVKLVNGLPLSYNTTEIKVIVRDPMWLFAFWDFCKTSFEDITEDFGFDTFILRIMLYSKDNLSESYDYYDITVDKDDRSQYIHLSFDDVVTKVSLCVRSIDESVLELATSNFIYLNRRVIPEQLCILDSEADKVAILSGLSLLKKIHFKNYRQAFHNDLAEENIE